MLLDPNQINTEVPDRNFVVILFIFLYSHKQKVLKCN